MKKVLTLFLAVCMLISIIPMAVSAEKINPKPAEEITTVYAANADYSRDTNETLGSKKNPYANFEAAYDAVIEVSGGTTDRKIVLLTDVSAFNDTSDKTIETTTQFFLNKFSDFIKTRHYSSMISTTKFHSNLSKWNIKMFTT